MKMTEEWEKEWQEIEVPKEAVFKVIEETVASEKRDAGPEKASVKRSTNVVLFIKKHRVKLGLVAVLGVLAVGGAISSNRENQTAKEARTQEVMSPQAKSSIPGDISGSAGADQMKKAESEQESVAQNSISTEQKLVKTYVINKETREFDHTLESIATAVESVTGYFSQSDIANQTGANYLRSANYVIRIPQERVTDFIKQLAEIGETVSSSENTTDYSVNYTDNQSQIKALQTEEEALLKLLEKSDKVQDMITIQDRLSQVRSSKDSLIQQNKLIDNQVAETEVTLSVSEVKTTTKEKNATIVDEIKDNWRAQRVFWRETGQRFVVFLLSVGPYLVGLSVVVIVGWRLSRKRRM